MLAFGHPGLTLGVATLAAGAAARWERPWIDRLAGWVDIRVLLIGSLLPDIIDKPLGMLFLAGTFSNGRIFAHTLIFLAILSAGGWLLYRARHRTWLLALAFGTLTHLVFDQMWLNPRTLLWPAYGWSFARGDLSDWLPHIFGELYKDPAVYIWELAGLIVLVWFAWLVLRRHKVRAFLLHGKIR